MSAKKKPGEAKNASNDSNSKPDKQPEYKRPSLFQGNSFRGPKGNSQVANANSSFKVQHKG